MSYLGENIKKLGFGLMRLPQQNDIIDIEQTKQMVDLFIKAGFTYFDTAWAYAGSEDAIHQALVERYPRQSYQLATKNAAWINCKTKEEAIDQFETSLKRTGAGYFDFYLLHNLGEGRTRFFDDFDMWAWIQQKKQEGLIRHIGFSFHSTPEELEEILLAHPEMEFVQLQINYADWENPAVQSKKCYEIARKYKKPVIIMEPVKGGSLVKLPDDAAAVLRNAAPDEPLAAWALRFAASLPGVLTVLSGMSTPAQVEENVRTMRAFRPVGPEERAALDHVRAILDGIPTVPCTDCRYCLKSCPQGVRIPAALASLNILALYGDEHRAQENYDWNASAGPASSCVACGACEDVCPQRIGIVRELVRAAGLFEKR